MRIINLRQPILFAVALLAAPLPLAAQPAPAPADAAAPAQTSPAPAAPAQAAPPAPAQATPAQAAPAQAAPTQAAPAAAMEDNSIKEETIAAHAALTTHGATTSDDGYAKISEAVAKLRAAAQKAGLKENGRPLAVFSDAADNDFQFDAMLPVDVPPGAKLDLGPGVSLAQTPSGKALRFEHRGPYDDIDSTYDAIAAYLDAKGLEARNLYSEEFLNDAQDSSDMKLQVDIHVFMK
jgi:effector-binding domain-containing protein